MRPLHALALVLLGPLTASAADPSGTWTLHGVCDQNVASRATLLVTRSGNALCFERTGRYLTTSRHSRPSLSWTCRDVTTLGKRRWRAVYQLSGSIVSTLGRQQTNEILVADYALSGTTLTEVVVNTTRRVYGWGTLTTTGRRATTLVHGSGGGVVQVIETTGGYGLGVSSGTVVRRTETYSNGTTTITTTTQRYVGDGWHSTSGRTHYGHTRLRNQGRRVSGGGISITIGGKAGSITIGTSSSQHGGLPGQPHRRR
jgi:hypothetical protein